MQLISNSIILGQSSNCMNQAIKQLVQADLLCLIKIVLSNDLYEINCNYFQPN